MSDAPPRPVAVVTGASQGLGNVVAGFLAGAGYDLVASARRAGPLRAAVPSWERRGANVRAAAGAVESPEGRERIRSAVEGFGRLDVLVHNASELGPPGRPKLLDVSEAEFAHVFRVNVIAPVLLTGVLLPWLARSPAPLVVTISSDAAVGAYPGWGAYGASKAAFDLVSRTLSQELAEARVSVVAVDPGDLRTAMHQAAFLGEDISDRPLPEATVPFWAWLVGRVPATVSGQRFRAQSERWEASA